MQLSRVIQKALILNLTIGTAPATEWELALRSALDKCLADIILSGTQEITWNLMQRIVYETPLGPSKVGWCFTTQNMIWLPLTRSELNTWGSFTTPCYCVTCSMRRYLTISPLTPVASITWAKSPKKMMRSSKRIWLPYINSGIWYRRISWPLMLLTMQS